MARNPISTGISKKRKTVDFTDYLSPAMIKIFKEQRDLIDTDYREKFKNYNIFDKVMQNITSEELEKVNEALNRWKTRLGENGAGPCDSKTRPLLTIYPYERADYDEVSYSRGKILDPWSDKKWSLEDYLRKDKNHEPTCITVYESEMGVKALPPIRGDVTLLRRYINFSIAK